MSGQIQATTPKATASTPRSATDHQCRVRYSSIATVLSLQPCAGTVACARLGSLARRRGRQMTTAVAPTGLSAAEVAERVASGQVNDVPAAPTRTVAEIVRANVLTRFNFLLGSLLVVILWVGPLQDALFGLVLIANTLVGIVQEVRAKRTLDRLALISAPAARVVRDGRTREVAVGEVVLDDLLHAGPGEQIVVDGEVQAAAGAEVDESLLTGESEPVGKGPGEQVLSGSFVVAGTLAYRATKVGREAYAARLAEEARRFTLARSELRAAVDRIIGVVPWLLVPTAALLLASQLRSQGLREALRGAVAGTVHMIPEGLVLLVTVAFAVGVVRLGRRGRCCAPPRPPPPRAAGWCCWPPRPGRSTATSPRGTRSRRPWWCSPSG